jgi:acetyl esterase
MVAQVNSPAVKLLEVADDPRLSREVKAFLKVLNSTDVALEKLTPLEARQVLVDAQASVPVGATSI